MNDRALFQIEDISFESNDKAILEKITFAISPLRITLITGPSGSGKSTLLKIMAMLISPTSGRIYYNNRLLDDFAPSDYRSRAVLVGQKPFIVEGSVKDNLLLPFRLKANKEKVFSDEIFIRNLENLGLKNDFLKKNSAKLSGGESQRVALARAASLQPETLFLDEPSSALDIASEERIIKYLTTLKSQISMIIVAHSPAYLDIADRIVILKHGRITKETARLSSTELKKHLEEDL